MTSAGIAIAEARYALGRTLMQLGRTVEGQRQLAEFKTLRAAQIDEFRRMLDLEWLKHERPGGEAGEGMKWSYLQVLVTSPLS